MNRERAGRKLARSQRRARVAELVAAGKTTREAEAVLRDEGFTHVDHVTLARDLQRERQLLADKATSETQAHRDSMHRKLLALEANVAADADRGDARARDILLGIFDRTARLLGLNLEKAAPNVQVNVNAEGGRYLEFCRHSHGIAEADWPQVWAFMDSLPREQIVIDASYYPPAEDAVKTLPEAISGDSSHEQGERDAGGQS